MKRNATPLQWALGTASICVAVLIGSWLLVLGPRLDAAAATRTQAAEVHTQNQTLRAQVDALKADYAHLDEYRAELAALRTAIPDDVWLTDLTRQIDAAAAHAGVTVLGVAVEPAAALTGVPAAAPADPAAAEAPAPDTDAAEPAATGTVAAAPATAAPAAPVPGMVAIPLNVRVIGGVDAVRGFMSELQTGLARHVLITTLNVAALDDSEGDETRPSTVRGDIIATIGALTYVLQPDGGPAPRADVNADLMPDAAGAGGFTPVDAVPSDEEIAAAEAAAAQAAKDAAAQAATQAVTEAATQAAAAAQAAAQAAAAAAAVPAPAAPVEAPVADPGATG